MADGRPAAWAGGAHSRHAPLVIAVVLVGHALTVLAWDTVHVIQFAWDKDPRGVGAPDLIGALMSATIPALLVPTFTQDRRGGRRGRLVALGCCAAALAATIGILITWRLTLAVTMSPGDHPPVSSLIGNLALMGSLGWVCVLVLGRGWGQVTSLALTYTMWVAQQRWPDALIATSLSTGRQWHTSWTLTAAVLGVALLTAWSTSGIPLVEKVRGPS